VTLDASDFDYDLPAERIAQRPAARRDEARMLVLDRESGRTVDARFRDLPQRLRAGDLLVLNDTRVVPSRLLGRKASGGRIELLLVERVAAAEWSCLARAARAPAAGARIELPRGLRAIVLGRTGDRFHLRLEAEGADPAAIVAEVAGIPLPPYIARPEPADPDLAELDRERYQTVFAREPACAPRSSRCTWGRARSSRCARSASRTTCSAPSGS
jgi:S-adenosylmethionine:tRNA ribosyltransferase-isomerase